MMLIRILVFVVSLCLGICEAKEIYTTTAIFDEMHCSSKDIAIFVRENSETELYIIRDQANTQDFPVRMADQGRFKGRVVRIDWFKEDGFRVVKKIRLIRKRK